MSYWQPGSLQSPTQSDTYVQLSQRLSDSTSIIHPCRLAWKFTSKLRHHNATPINARQFAYKGHSGLARTSHLLLQNPTSLHHSVAFACSVPFLPIAITWFPAPSFELSRPPQIIRFATCSVERWHFTAESIPVHKHSWLCVDGPPSMALNSSAPVLRHRT